jgi:DNA mismatch endonuclease (patch repair protein)
MNRSANMRAIRSKGMLPELTVRSLVHKLGYRFRLHRSELPGKPDLVFPSRRKVIFVHGCFWHSHKCKIAHVPKSNQDYWGPKLERNKARDTKNVDALNKSGWKILVLWECETKDVRSTARRLRKFLGVKRVEDSRSQKEGVSKAMGFRYAPGDYVKVEFSEDATGIGEWMWVRVEICDDNRQLITGTLDNDPVNDYGGKLKPGTRLVVNYAQVREHRKPSEFMKH